MATPIVEPIAASPGRLALTPRSRSRGLTGAVDVEAELLFISTPVAADDLGGVDVICRTSLELPVALLQPTSVTPPSPYLAAGVLRAAGGGRMRSRNNIQRGAGARAR